MTGSARLVSAGALALCAGLILQAQTQTGTQPPPPQQPPVFRTGASLVRVDVTVTDRHGEPVTSLTADDFEIQEDGVPQSVAAFKLVSADGRPAEDDDTSLAIRSPEHAAAEAARDEVRVFLIFWDEYHIGRFASALHARKALTDFVRTAFGPTDLVALMDPLLPTDAIRWTRNRGDLALAVQKLKGRFREYLPPRSIIEEAQIARRDVERLRSEVTISAVKAAASYLGGLREGRKAIIFISEGLPALDRTDEVSLIQDLIRAANDNNTAIYTLDPRGLIGGFRDELLTIAESTGAEAFMNTNAPEKALRQVVKDASAFYLLGYASARNPTDGKFHQIKVRVRRSGFEVRARKGYWAPTATDIDRAAREATAGPPPEIAAALSVLSTRRPERAVDLWAGTSLDVDRTPQVTVTWTLRPRAASARAPEGSVSVIVQGPGGTRGFEARLDARRLSFPAEPGLIQLHTTVRDAEAQTIDEDTRALSVPDFAHARLAIASPAAFRAANPVELRSLRADSDPTPYAAREFVRTDRLFVRFAVLGEAAPRAAISARLVSRTGADLVSFTVTPLQGARDQYEIDLPLSSVARGDYLVAIQAAAGDDRAEVFIPLRIVS